MIKSLSRYVNRYEKVLPLKVLADTTTALGVTAIGAELMTNGSQAEGLKGFAVVAVGCIGNIVLKNQCAEELPVEVLRDSASSDNI